MPTLRNVFIAVSVASLFAASCSSSDPGSLVADSSPVTSSSAAAATVAPTEVATTVVAATAAPTVPLTAPPTLPPQPAPAALMPDVVCMNLQDAQDYIQTFGVFFSRSVDATGQGRSQIIDSNWLVVDQSPAPGEPFGEGDAVLSVVKYGEGSC